MKTNCIPDVSRETMEMLKAYDVHLQSWSQKINLISKASEADSFKRHILDSAQLAELIPDNVETLADFGSGGGLPGVVLAIMARETHPERHHILVESDKRKSAFLHFCRTELSLNLSIIADRIEEIPKIGAQVVTSRALAALPRLLELASPHLTQGGALVLLKGAKYQDEIDEARKAWDLQVTDFPSQTDESGRILIVRNPRKRSTPI